MPITKLCKIAAQDPPTSLLRCPKDHKISPPPCIGAEKRKQVSIICPCTSMQACSFRHFHYVFRSSTLHSNSYTHIPAVSTPRKEWLIQSSYQSQTHCLVFALCFSLFRFIQPCKGCRLCSLYFPATT